MTSDEQAQHERFLGSPTVRVGGVDVDPDAEGRLDYGLTCRAPVDEDVRRRALGLGGFACRRQVGNIAWSHVARAARVVLRRGFGDVTWSTWPSDGRDAGATLGASAAATPGIGHMIVEQLAPDVGHRRELSCEPPAAERACGRLDHPAPLLARRALRREWHRWARGQLFRRVRPVCRRRILLAAARASASAEALGSVSFPRRERARQPRDCAARWGRRRSGRRGPGTGGCRCRCAAGMQSVLTVTTPNSPSPARTAATRSRCGRWTPGERVVDAGSGAF